MVRNRTFRASRSRRGSIYLTTLGVSLLVMVIGLSALTLGRIQSRAGATANDFAEARICARSGLELGMNAIYNDPYWRTRLGNGAWFTNKPIGAGSFSLSASDPVDGDVTNGENDPVILTATGTKGSARYVTSMRMEVSPRVGSCLEVSACSANDISISAGTLTSDQTISANHNVSAGGSAIVNANVEAYNAVQGGGYTKTTKVTRLKRTMPDPLHALDYYRANGTHISYTSLLLSKSTELIANEKFELDTSGWYASGLCTLKRSTSVYKEGLASLRVTARGSVTAVAATELPLNAIIKGHTYSVNFPVYCAAANTMQVVLTLTTTTDTFTFSSPTAYVAQATWTNLKTDSNSLLVPTWSGTLTKATVTVSSTTNKDYYLDGLSFKDTTFPDGTYVLDGQLLTSTINPYGSANPRGIYVLDCGGKRVLVRNSRIIGTLVMLNAGGNSGLQGSVIIEPAVQNFPVFLTDSQVSISLSSTALSEDTVGANFNPPGAPYPYLAGTGTFTNATTTDSYPSALNGLVYSTQDLTIDTGTTVNGVVVGTGKIQVDLTSLNLKYNSIYLNNPPPGFVLGTIQMTPVPGTWQRAPASGN